VTPRFSEPPVIPSCAADFTFRLPRLWPSRPEGVRGGLGVPAGLRSLKVRRGSADVINGLSAKLVGDLRNQRKTTASAYSPIGRFYGSGAFAG
jgi:hypothetical protein